MFFATLKFTPDISLTEWARKNALQQKCLYFSKNDKKTVLFTAEKNENVILSSNNLRNAVVKNIDDINTYDIVNADSVFFDEASLKKLNDIFK